MHRWEAPVGEMGEKHVIGHESGHRNNAPACDLFKLIAQLFHIRDAAVGQ
jgi:hypothetical protein